MGMRSTPGSMAAIKGYECTGRIEELARSKPLPPGFMADRRSVYWVDRYPFQPSEEGTTNFVLTPRQEYLCNPKKPHPLYKGDRPSPLWSVATAAKRAYCSDHIGILAIPKSVPVGYQRERSVYTHITQDTMNASASGRLEQLAQPKPHKMWLNNTDTYQEGNFTDPITKINPAVLTSACRPRVEALAEAKHVHNNYIGERPVQWAVSDQAKNSTATLRLQQLARPKSGRMLIDDYDPYRVSAAAKTTRASPRVGELAMPLGRKCRSKKIVA